MTNKEKKQIEKINAKLLGVMGFYNNVIRSIPAMIESGKINEAEIAVGLVYDSFQKEEIQSIFNHRPDVYSDCLIEFVFNVLEKEFKNQIFTSKMVYEKFEELDYLKYISNNSSDKKKSICSTLYRIEANKKVIRQNGKTPKIIFWKIA